MDATRPFNVVLLTALVVMSANQTLLGQTHETHVEVKTVIENYCSAMSVRDVERLLPLFQSNFVVTDTKLRRSQSSLLSFANISELLPLEGDKNWENALLSEIDIKVSEPDDSVAIVHFTTITPLSDDDVEAFKRAYLQGQNLTLRQKHQFWQRINSKQIIKNHCAMLAYSKGDWKITSLSIPARVEELISVPTNLRRPTKRLTE